jgi:hypothetical protein
MEFAIGNVASGQQVLATGLKVWMRGLDDPDSPRRWRASFMLPDGWSAKVADRFRLQLADGRSGEFTIVRLPLDDQGKPGSSGKPIVVSDGSFC